MGEEVVARKGDMLSMPWLTVLVWRAPLLLMIIGGFSGPAVRTPSEK